MKARRLRARLRELTDRLFLEGVMALAEIVHPKERQPMPHYKDGTEVKPGDSARGKSSSSNGRVVEGVVVRVHPSTACNLVLARVVPRHVANLMPGIAIEGTDKVAALTYEYGDCSEFELVHREEG